MKAILILDIDEKTYNSNVTSISFENNETIFFMKDVKLKPLPEKEKHKNNYALTEHMWIDGYNACIDEILGVNE